MFVVSVQLLWLHDAAALRSASTPTALALVSTNELPTTLSLYLFALLSFFLSKSFFPFADIKLRVATSV